MPKKLVEILSVLNNKHIPFQFNRIESYYTKDGTEIYYSLEFLFLTIYFDEKGEQVK